MNNIDPIQRDMFASFDATQVATSVKTPATTSGIPTLVEYANKIAMRVSPKEHTRNHNLRGCRWCVGPISSWNYHHFYFYCLSL